MFTDYKEQIIASDKAVPSSNKPLLKSLPATARQFVVLLLLSLALTGSAYRMLNKKAAATIPVNKQDKCMFWDGRRYLPVSCDKKISGSLVVPYDSIKIARFQRIVQVDTIQEGAIGRVWYIKLDGRVEYYTSGGFHPVYTDRPLLPLTRDMIFGYQVH